MPDDTPPWVRQYIGLEFKSHGRTREGLDCWGLGRLVLYEQTGVLIPSYVEEYESATDRANIPRILENHEETENWVSVVPGTEKIFDFLKLRRAGMPMHVAVVIKRGKMLHIERGANSGIEDYRGPLWKHRIIGIYRHRKLL